MVKRGVVLEYVVGGGLMHAEDAAIPPSFRQEGWTMLANIAEDWSSSRTNDETWEVIVPVDPRTPKWFSLPKQIQFQPMHSDMGFLEQWCRLAVDADAVILIAPESEGELTRLACAIDEVTDARLGCRTPFLERASNKLMMAEYISDEYLHPQTLPPDQFVAYAKSIPTSSQREWIIKPIDGAGCDGIWRGKTQAILAHLQQHANCPDSLIQHYLPGRPASVTAWITSTGRWWLPPVWQDIQWAQSSLTSGLTLDRPTYLGGSGPIDRQHWATIHAFANRVLDLLGPGALGWVGIDFVMNVENNMARYAAIEVNPRWTTSYAGLRQLYQGNLLEKFLELSHDPKSPYPTAAEEKWKNQIVNWSTSVA